jgi:hypothetical protein
MLRSSVYAHVDVVSFTPSFLSSFYFDISLFLQVAARQGSPFCSFQFQSALSFLFSPALWTIFKGFERGANAHDWLH